MVDSHYTIYPVGIVHKDGDGARVEIFGQFREAMLGLGGFSHINVIFWFHENDLPEKRAILQVHPRNNPANPLTGVFATHSPVRPNLVGLTRCRILSIKDNVIYIDDIDAAEGTPVIDVKCFIPEEVEDVRVPGWV